MVRDMTSLSELNEQSAAEFTTTLGHIFEHSPWVAERAAPARPYASIEALHQAMVSVVEHASRGEQLALLNAHPELAARVELTAASAAEQGGKGLDRLSGEQAAALREGNAAYRQRMGFPFIIAVRGQRDITAILDAITQRLQAEPEKEHFAALNEVAKIARFRLDDLIDGKS